jgi:uncharacterized protein
MHVGSFESMFGVAIDRDGIDQLMREHEIENGVVFHPDNAYVAEVVESVPGLYGLVWANPRLPGYLDPNDPLVHPLIELLVERDMPTLIHCGHPIFTLPWSIEELAVGFPTAKIILGHMGHGNVVYINGSIEVALRNSNVYLETSGMPMHTKIREAYERVGETRVLFGSDIPFHHPIVEIKKVELSGLPPEGVERVLSRNGRRLFFGDEGATAPVGR